MSIPKKERESMKRLAQEGKRISKITEEDFPEYNYWDIYTVIYGSGGRGALGVKRMIANRLYSLMKVKGKKQQEVIIEEIDELVWHLYESLKANQQKLDGVRKILMK